MTPQWSNDFFRLLVAVYLHYGVQQFPYIGQVGLGYVGYLPPEV